jgi:hypothetical protein
VAPELNVSGFATGLDSPRGLAFGPDGYLGVAEGGRGGTATTVGRGRRPPVEPVDPALGESRDRGRRRRLIDRTLYALVSGAGCSHGLPGTANGVYRIDEAGSAELVADLGAYRASTTVANSDPDDDEYDGTWYSMVEVDGALYAIEPNHGEIVRVTLDGQVSRVVDIWASQGHVVPTAIVSFASAATATSQNGPRAS